MVAWQGLALRRAVRGNSGSGEESFGPREHAFWPSHWALLSQMVWMRLGGPALEKGRSSETTA